MSMLSGIVSAVFLTGALVLIVRAARERIGPPLQPMTAPSVEPFLRRYAQQAAREHRRVWLKYRHPDGQVSEGTVEIYHTTWSGLIRGWCHTQNRRCTFRRGGILAWQLLDERFERSNNMEAWSEWEGWYEQVRELKGAMWRP